MDFATLIQNSITTLFGPIEPLNYALHHLFFRSLLVYIVTIALVRFGQKRFIGEHTAFDYILAVMIGSIMSRIIIEDFSLLDGIVVAFFLILFHSILAFISYYSNSFGNIVKGNKRLLVENGKMIKENMRKSSLSEEDLMSALRREGTADIKDVEKEYLERNGKISVLKKE